MAERHVERRPWCCHLDPQPLRFGPDPLVRFSIEWHRQEQPPHPSLSPPEGPRWGGAVSLQDIGRGRARRRLRPSDAGPADARRGRRRAGGDLVERSRPPSAIAMTTTISSGRGASATDTVSVSKCGNDQEPMAAGSTTAAVRPRSASAVFDRMASAGAAPSPFPLPPRARDGEGRYRFKTIKPAAYRAGPNLIRPALIHFQVTGKEDRLVTQMYFENDPYNATDPILNSAPLKQLLITKMLDPSPEMEAGSKMVIFDIVVYRG